MLHSLSAQVNYYSQYIQQNPAWEYTGVYVYEALTGTKDSRPEFQRMLADCKAGKIDRILTKSLSRFARNTVTVLESVRMLKSLGIDVYFEEGNIHSLGADSELILTLLASFAQEESLSVSENQKWRIRKGFEQGEVMCWRFMLGYRIEHGKVEINPDGAEIVRDIFHRAIAGETYGSICRRLNAQGKTGALGKPFRSAHIRDILTNEKYTGNALLQKTFVRDHLSKRQVANKGELPQYYATETHPAIIDERPLTPRRRLSVSMLKGVGIAPSPNGASLQRKYGAPSAVRHISGLPATERLDGTAVHIKIRASGTAMARKSRKRF